ncbi:PQQ-dependent sugar dehydrogenase [Candidatus Aminicenantes bacterium AC-335-A11]|nr:PQQ-dependent sugar dehydrogenase [SCandidatus Aminicenantes bacterium Aminicenantia_JdfR_composite]MCP2596620.1 PQQ-dependent sugar dehydrogenase [Candidatus Aminicenantes bacterium AC-335-G13]MCP2598054.1 PQQ-dependent sugar dehydrogenase [Candidatus Aminicenantes bacterium AC-335-L06]MCP2606565.1 PQQ-dependent sugar dehydrogenase [Candidatus Aminicenantes bacterium AC-708-I09]MCP2618362.1 PQQ-dependent sugar dehydrogenase [Candidatus Aminicenantes bacterium AC-335-A11]
MEESWQIREGFKVEKIVSGLSLPVNIAFVPNPKSEKDAPFFYVTELYGSVKVITNEFKVFTFADNLLNYEPDYSMPGTGESGVIGIAVHENGDVFVSLIYKEDNLFKNKVLKFKSKDGLKAETAETIIDNIPSINAAHQIQALTIYEDKLYVNIGDGMVNPEVAQDDNDLRGKILRMNLDGSIPDDNPFPNSYVYAKGFRNPFGATWRKSDNHLYISDNGPAVDDRIAKVLPGENYGWPMSMRTNSIFVWWYTQAPTAIDFAGLQFGPEYEDHLFIALFGYAYVEGRGVKGKKIVEMVIDEHDNVVYLNDFLRYVGKGPASVCGLAFGPDGLYFTDLHGEVGFKRGEKSGGNIWRIARIK